jgi:hypothetical protein
VIGHERVTHQGFLRGRPALSADATHKSEIPRRTEQELNMSLLVCHRNRRGCRFVVTLTVLAVLFVSARPAQADWDDNSGDLPGISSTKTVIITAAAATGALVALLHWNKKRNRTAAPASPSTGAHAQPLDASAAIEGVVNDDLWRRVAGRYRALSEDRREGRAVGAIGGSTFGASLASPQPSSLIAAQ